MFAKGIKDSLFWSQIWVTLAWDTDFGYPQVPSPNMKAISWILQFYRTKKVMNQDNKIHYLYT